MQKRNTIIAAGLAALLALTLKAKAEEKKAPKLQGFAQTTLSSKYITDSGTQIGEGPVAENVAGLTLGPLTGFVWGGYDFGINDWSEIDYGLTLDLPLVKGENHNLGLNLTYKHWTYPGMGWNSDNVGVVGVSYNGLVNAKLQLHHLFETSTTETGDRVGGRIDKPILLYELDDLAVRLNPSITAAYHDKFFGRQGLGHITPGIAIQLTKGRFSLEAFVNQQFSIADEIKDEDIGTYGGGRLKISF